MPDLNQPGDQLDESSFFIAVRTHSVARYRFTRLRLLVRGWRARRLGHAGRDRRHVEQRHGWRGRCEHQRQRRYRSGGQQWNGLSARAAVHEWSALRHRRVRKYRRLGPGRPSAALPWATTGDYAFCMKDFAFLDAAGNPVVRL